MFQAIRQLLALKRMKIKPRADRKQAIENIKKLYSLGFTAEEIYYFVDWVKLDTIKKYCRRVEVKDVEQKTEVLKKFEEFIERDCSWDEMALYVKEKEALADEDLSFKDLIYLKRYVDNIGIEFDNFKLFMNEFKKRNMDWEEFINAFFTTGEMFKSGYDLDFFKKLQVKAMLFGGVKNVLDSIENKLTLEEIIKILQEHRKELDLIKEEKRKWENLMDQQATEIKLKQVSLGVRFRRL